MFLLTRKPGSKKNFYATKFPLSRDLVANSSKNHGDEINITPGRCDR
jgi:hypothetical protein